jgi:hypothetical protein
MGFFQSSFRARLPVRTRAPIFAVGRRVEVVSPRHSPARLTSTADGADALTSLADGTEVEILAWRPRSSGTHYRVRSTRAGLEGWLAGGSLRSAESASVPPTPGRNGVRLRTRASARPLKKQSA